MSQALTRDGTPWQPRYLEAIDPATCIGCARCYKGFPRDVIKPAGVTEEGEIVDFDDDEAFRKVMAVDNPGDCTGCAACAKTCSTTAMSFVGA